MAIQPLDEMGVHAPEHGRLRYGKQEIGRNGKMRPTAIPYWRLTSPDRQAIEQAAELWGGEPKPWDEPKASIRDQWEVVTTSATIPCWLLPGSFNQSREAWAGGSLQRRCDGRTCSLYSRTGTGHGQPCWCNENGLQDGDKDACKIVSRVQLILPDLRFGGVWRLEAKGQVFAHEAPGMIQIIEQLQPQGALSSVELTLTQRSKVTAQGVNHFIVPVFTLGSSPAQMLAGQAQVQLSGGPTLALEAPIDIPYEGDAAPPPRMDEFDDPEIQDAVLIDFPMRGTEAEARQLHPSSRPIEDDMIALLEESIAQVEAQKAEENGWDRPPPNINVRRNPDPAGPKWIRK